MGLAAVTEANTGDFTVKLKAKRSRSVDDVMEDVRAQVKATEPELDIELTQVLQDKINDLSNSPEPIQIKIFSDDANAGPTRSSRRRRHRQDSRASWMWRTESRTPSAARQPTFRSIRSSRRGSASLPLEVSQDATAILDGIATADPLIANGRPYTDPRPPRR